MSQSFLGRVLNPSFAARLLFGRPSPERPGPGGPVAARVSLVHGTVVGLDQGMRAGIRAGHRMTVHRLLEVIYNPDDPTQEMDRLQVKIGEVVVGAVDEDHALATFRGRQTVRVGDRVSS